MIPFLAAIPQSGPSITGVKDTYGLGEMVDLNCTSYSSDPLPEIVWYINSELVSFNRLTQQTIRKWSGCNSQS